MVIVHTALEKTVSQTLKKYNQNKNYNIFVSRKEIDKGEDKKTKDSLRKTRENLSTSIFFRFQKCWLIVISHTGPNYPNVTYTSKHFICIQNK